MLSQVTPPWDDLDVVVHSKLPFEAVTRYARHQPKHVCRYESLRVPKGYDSPPWKLGHVLCLKLVHLQCVLRYDPEAVDVISLPERRDPLCFNGIHAHGNEVLGCPRAVLHSAWDESRRM